MTTKANAPYPYLGVNGEYFDKAFLESVEADLFKKAPIWASGIEQPSPCDKFAYHVLTQIKMTALKEPA
ncbi:MAG: hypothetical protein E5V54_24080 [Mesorhizobium sp.]|nr:MAG: hypothetical protein E5V54_24080 [Mesorhizobium sp.]